MQHILVINIENSATCFGSIEPSSGQIRDTVDVHESVHRDTTMKITNKMHCID